MFFYIKTYGCQMNVNDSEKMRHILEKKGLLACDNEDDADIVIINSCAVREKPQEKVFSYAGRMGKDKKVIAAGCVAQAEKRNILERSPNIDYVTSWKKQKPWLLTGIKKLSCWEKMSTTGKTKKKT
jgi:tRNA-2-methylthio-N6-dimethylallyladenosine synthase